MTRRSASARRPPRSPTRVCGCRWSSASDGGASHPGIDAAASGSSWNSTRRAELHEATAVLGLPAPICLGLPDGELSDHEERLADLLTEILEHEPDRDLVSPRRGAATVIPITRPSVARQRSRRSAAVPCCWSTRSGCGTGRHPATPPCRGTGCAHCPVTRRCRRTQNGCRAVLPHAVRGGRTVRYGAVAAAVRVAAAARRQGGGVLMTDQALDRLLRPDVLRVGRPLAARRPVVRAAQVRDHVGAVALSRATVTHSNPAARSVFSPNSSPPDATTSPAPTSRARRWTRRTGGLSTPADVATVTLLRRSTRRALAAGGRFDLVVLSELCYYLHPEVLRDTPGPRGAAAEAGRRRSSPRTGVTRSPNTR